jgi:hypothetical protein
MGLIGSLVGGALEANKAIRQNRAKNDNTFKTVVVQNRYSINVPSFLSPRNKLGGDASLQYWSRTLDILLQVTDEPKSEFIETVKELEKELPDLGVGESLLDDMMAVSLSNLFDIDKVDIGNYTQIKINNLNAIRVNAFQKSTFFKDAMYGSFAFIEGKNTLYQIAILSGGTSISKLSDKLEDAIYSFKEL